MLESYKPPTDVLYKFMAVAGLVIAVAAGWRSTTIQLEEHRLQMLVMDKIHERILAVEKHVNRNVENAKSQLRSEGIEPTSELLTERYKKISEENPLASILVQPEIDRLHQELRVVRIDKEAERFILMDVSFPFGCVLMFTGFSLWYSKVQRPLDTILAAQAAEAANIQTKPTSRRSLQLPRATKNSLRGKNRHVSRK